MLICPECGTRNTAGTRFCTNCGTYLEWDNGPHPTPGRAMSTPTSAPEPWRNDPAPTPEPRPVPAPERHAEPSSEQHPTVPQDEPASEPVRTHHKEGKVSKWPANPEPDDRTVVLPRMPENEARSRSGHRPGDPPPIPPEEIRVRHPRPPEEEPETPPAPGEIVCPRCGAGNSPDRHFCRRCALDLSRALASPPPQSAGQSRPRQKGLSPLVWALIVLVVLVVVYLVWNGVTASGSGSALGGELQAGRTWSRSSPPPGPVPESMPSDASMSQ
ncbi:zinc-ribbon domain-containing protein [Kocuria sediminis]|uniref:Zinc-ribbon domain-containing protein n=1 Tax=Kocuria sediminis TaxID=1038857 RepID=A0A6N8GFL9_9MICC|nr:zinc-ribbon domain-containing protein [Kocuria sediminis]